MRGITKAFQRAPHLVTSRVGMATKSTDAVTDALVGRFTGMEEHTQKLLKDATAFRDAVSTLMSSSSDFANGFKILFSPIGGESSYEFENKFPNARLTIEHIGDYDAAFAELQETVRPEIELIESRVLAPTKELAEYVKKIRKTITKRDHKLVDYDRHNNTYTKLREKKEKSLSDEKNMFKVEQDYEAATSEYEHYNNLLQTELPQFFDMAQAFITPLFHSFYYMQLNIFYVMLEKLNAFAQQAGFDLANSGEVESIFIEKQGDAAERLNDLSITKRGMSTAQIMSQARASNPDRYSSGSSPLRSRPSMASRTSSAGASRFTPPISRHNSTSSSMPGGRTIAAPPPYSSGGSEAAAAAGASGKRAPPPPPPLKPRPSTGPKPIYCTALYDFQAQTADDLSFQTGDKIMVTEKGSSAEEWWQGKVNGVGPTGAFPGNYVQLDA